MVQPYTVDVLPNRNIPHPYPSGERLFSLLDSLWSSIGWRERGEAKWREALDHSRYCAYARIDTALVGFGRFVGDGTMGMFYDIGVHPAHQRKGVGRTLMTKLLDKVRDSGYASLGLFAWEYNPGNIAFYQSLGFERVSTGMECIPYMRRE
ncbi:GNAT family N-acetyltransferase [Candidatus Woesearchaeota archaeon]|nr:GNAT family N-acetyltransferase [Candidatus Woesearchaeota archaeon]